MQRVTYTVCRLDCHEGGGDLDAYETPQIVKNGLLHGKIEKYSAALIFKSILLEGLSLKMF